MKNINFSFSFCLILCLSLFVFISSVHPSGIGIVDTINKKDLISLSTSELDTLGQKLFRNKDFKGAIKVFEILQKKGRNEEELLATNNQLINSHRYLGNQYRIKGEFAKAISYFKSAMEIDGADIRTKAKSYNNIGNCFSEMGEFNKAFEYLLKALKLKEESGIAKKDYSGTLANIGNVQSNLGLYNDAYKTFMELLSIDELRTRSKAIICINFGSLLSSMDSIASSSAMHYKALGYFTEINDSNGIGSCMINLANISMDNDKNDEALVDYKKALIIFEKIKYTERITLTEINIAKLLIKMKNSSGALEYANSALEDANKTGNINVSRHIYRVLSDIYTEMNKYEKAFDYEKLYSQINDSLFSQKLSGKIAQTQVLYDIERIENEKKSLKKENTLKGIAFDEQRKALVYLIVGAILVLIFSIIIFVLFLNKNKTNRFLVQKNLEIVSSEQRMQEKIKKLSENQTSKPKEVPIKDDSENKYLESNLSDERKKELLNLIEDAIFNDKVFLNPNFTMRSFADDINTNRNYISQIINEKYNVNFSSFINEQRINEARRMLSNQENHNLTIEGISQNVGFKSKTSFNNAFKKHTGITPSYFIKTVKEGASA